MRVVFAFLLRWIATSFGLWVALHLFGTGEDAVDATTESSVFLVAGLILSAINSFIKPIVAFISFPITFLTLGLFTLIVNGLMVYWALQLTPGMSITFWTAVLTSIVIGVVNFGINETLDAIKGGK